MFWMSMVAAVVLAQGDPWADASPALEYGPGAGFGQEYYPNNILGPPDPDATPAQPASSPEELLTLGEEGWVVLEFTDNVVVDEPGVDFTVFENVLDYGSGYFREVAFVDVSADGVNWTRFPWDGVTLEGLAGVWPTTGEDPTDPSVSGGDQFDLADVGMSWISHVRLVDCGEQVSDGGLFDLDAVAAVHWTTGIQEQEEPCEDVLRAPSPFGNQLNIYTETEGELLLYSIEGRLLLEQEVGSGRTTVNTSLIPGGCYLLVLRQGSGTVSVRHVVRL